MDWEAAEVGRGEDDVDLAAFHAAAHLRRDLGGEERGVGDTSDPNWSPEMQAAWPHFIMGVSQLWLELIREIDRSGNWPKDPLARYAAIESALNEHWRSEAGHALLHHLSAVFGYREFMVNRREAMRF